MSHVRRLGGFPYWLVVVGVLLPLPRLRAEDNAELLTLVRAGHRAARESIHTLSTTITKEITFPKKQLFASGKYWRSLNVVRVQETFPGSGIEDLLWKNSEIRQVGRSRKPDNNGYFYAATRKPPTDLFCLCDVWTDMLIDLPGPNGGQTDFDRFLEFATQPPQVKRVKLDGQECVRLTVSFDTAAWHKTDVTLWHDIDHNYLIRKLAATYENGARGEVEVLEFVESPPGVFLPTKCRRRSYQHGKQTQGDLTTLSDVQINGPIPPNVFPLPAIPAGTILNDWVQGTAYPVDTNWRPIGNATPISKLVVTNDAVVNGVDYRSPSREEPRSFARWIFLASLLVLVAGGMCWLYRRYLSQRPGHA